MYKIVLTLGIALAVIGVAYYTYASEPLCGWINHEPCNDYAVDCTCEAYDPPGGCYCKAPNVVPPGAPPGNYCYCTDWGGDIQYDRKTVCIVNDWTYEPDPEGPSLQLSESAYPCEDQWECGGPPPIRCGAEHPWYCLQSLPPKCVWVYGRHMCESRKWLYAGALCADPNDPNSP